MTTTYINSYLSILSVEKTFVIDKKKILKKEFLSKIEKE
jgi:hypothetical protein